jgi:hypothetical protein
MVGMMRGHDHGEMPLLSQRFEEGHQALLPREIKAARGLVKEKNLRLLYEGASDLHFLLLAA